MLFVFLQQGFEKLEAYRSTFAQFLLHEVKYRADDVRNRMSLLHEDVCYAGLAALQEYAHA